MRKRRPASICGSTCQGKSAGTVQAGDGGMSRKALDITRNLVVNVKRWENGVIIAYSLPGKPGVWYFPLIEGGRNVEPYVLLEEAEQLTIQGVR